MSLKLVWAELHSEFHSSLSYIVRTCLEKKETNKNADGMT